MYFWLLLLTHTQDITTSDQSRPKEVKIFAVKQKANLWRRQKPPLTDRASCGAIAEAVCRVSLPQDTLTAPEENIPDMLLHGHPATNPDRPASSGLGCGSTFYFLSSFFFTSPPTALQKAERFSQLPADNRRLAVRVVLKELYCR